MRTLCLYEHRLYHWSLQMKDQERWREGDVNESLLQFSFDFSHCPKSSPKALKTPKLYGEAHTSQLVIWCPQETPENKTEHSLKRSTKQRSKTRKSSQPRGSQLQLNRSKSLNWNHPRQLMTWWFPNLSWHLRKLTEEIDRRKETWNSKNTSKTQTT